MKNVLTALIVGASMLLGNIADARTSSSSRSSSSFSSSSRSSGSSSYSSGSKSSSSSSGFGSSSKSYGGSSSATSSAKSETKSSWFSKPNTAKPQTSTRPASAVDTARYQNAVKSGKAFTTRESAVADFKAKNATKYTSRFASEPTTRPSYIPTTYRHPGSNVSYNIVYNQAGGGYGYWNALGTFMLYDALTDDDHCNNLMRNEGYHVGPAPQPVVVQDASWGFWNWFFAVIGIAFVGILLFWFFRLLFAD